MWCTHGERARGVSFFVFWSALSQRGKEAEQRVVRCKSLHGLSSRCGFFRDLFFGCEVRFEVPVGGLLGEHSQDNVE